MTQMSRADLLLRVLEGNLFAISCAAATLSKPFHLAKLAGPTDTGRHGDIRHADLLGKLSISTPNAC